MATATLPAAPDPFRASTDVLFEVIDGQVVELPPMGGYEADIANFLDESINQHARKDRPAYHRGVQ